MDAAKEEAISEDVKALRNLWIESGRPEYRFWALMMQVWQGTFPAHCINDRP